MTSSIGSYSSSFLGVRSRNLRKENPKLDLGASQKSARSAHFSLASLPGYSSSMVGMSLPDHSFVGFLGAERSTNPGDKREGGQLTCSARRVVKKYSQSM